MGMQADRERWNKAGLDHEFFELGGAEFLRLIEPMRKRIEADPTLVVRMQDKALTSEGMQTLWHYLAGRRSADGTVAALAEGEDDCAFNIAKPCPPC